MSTCPVIDLSRNACNYNGMEISCSSIRECDHLTGAVHYEYAMPEGNVNPNIWVLGADGAWRYNGPDAPNVAPPIIPEAPSYAPVAHTVLPTYTAIVQPGAIVPTLPGTPAPAPATGTPTAPSQQYWSGGAPANNSGSKPAAGGRTWLDDLTELNLRAELGSTGIPLWVLLVAAAGGGYLLLGGSKR